MRKFKGLKKATAITCALSMVVAGLPMSSPVFAACGALLVNRRLHRELTGYQLFGVFGPKGLIFCLQLIIIHSDDFYNYWK